MTDEPINSETPRVLERQGGERPDVPHDAQFSDLYNRATWRPPNREELAAIKERDPFADRSYLAVIDGYVSDTPGFTGPLVVQVGSGDPDAMMSYALEHTDDGLRATPVREP